MNKVIITGRHTAIKMLEIFFWYYHNYKKATAPRG